jgi:hypothetical protein
MKRAEALCKRKKNTTYDWSPVLARMGAGSAIGNKEDNALRIIPI